MKNKYIFAATLFFLTGLSSNGSLLAQPTVCDPIVNSGLNHSIIIANLSPTLNGDPLPVGSYIIVQYERQGELICGGFAQWNGENTFMAVYGDDSLTPEKDGFASDEAFQFLVELPDGTLIENDNIQTEYLNEGIYTNAGLFAANGISGFSLFSATTALLASPVVFLQGPYDPTANLMHDVLRTNALLPFDEPFTGLGYAHVGSGGEIALSAAFDVAGVDAIVDWVFLELRDKTDYTIVKATRSALLQRDGDVVDVDGVSPVSFTNLPADDYYLVVKHRNHLGVMSASPIALSKMAIVVDFTSDFDQVFGSLNGIADLGDGFLGLYSGDFNHSGQIQNTDFNFMIPTLGVPAGYLPGDHDLNGQVQNTDLQLKLIPNIGRGQPFGL